jgi:hypothetical protein
LTPPHTVWIGGPPTPYVPRHRVARRPPRPNDTRVIHRVFAYISENPDLAIREIAVGMGLEYGQVQSATRRLHAQGRITAPDGGFRKFWRATE